VSLWLIPFSPQRHKNTERDLKICGPSSTFAPMAGILTKSFSTLVLLFLSLAAAAQYDSAYIKTYSDYLSLIAASSDRIYSLTIKDAENKDNNASYQNSAGTSIGVGFDYKWLALEYQQSIGNTTTSSEPKSLFSYISLGLSGQKFYAKMFYQDQQGMYLDGHGGINLPGAGQPQIYRDDIRCRTLFLTGNYLFNGRKYSNSAAVNQSARQLKSVGSFVAGLSFISNSITSDSDMVPKSVGFSIGENGRMVKGLVNSIIPQAGYTHMFVHKTFYLAITAIPGVNFVSFVKELSNNESAEGTETSGFFLEERISIGYNGDKFYAGIGTNGYLFTGEFDSNPVTQNHQYFRLQFGIRFLVKKPKFFPEKIF